MYHPFPKLFKGNYPFAVLHAARIEGFEAGVAMALKLAVGPGFTTGDAEAYVAACLATKGNPQILDLIEGGQS